jgi:serine/threonine protein kinase, bacterial
VPDFGGDYGGYVSEVSERTGLVAGGAGAGYRPGGVAADPVTREVFDHGDVDNTGYGATMYAASEVTGKLIATIPLPYGNNPGPMAVDPRAGVVCAIDYDSDSGWVLSAVGEKSDALAASVPLGRDPDGLAVDPRAGTLYVSDGYGAVSVISWG